MGLRETKGTLMHRSGALAFVFAAAASTIACHQPIQPKAKPEAAEATEAGAVDAHPNAPFRQTLHQATSLGVSFALPRDRTVGDCAGVRSGETPCITLRQQIAGTEVVVLVLQRYDLPLERVAREEAGFEPNAEGRWMTTYGRFQPVEVQRITGQGWAGMRAVITCGISDADTGFHAAAGECLYQVMSDGQRSIPATTDGRYGLDDQTAATLSSIRFIDQP
jgi:hypothetical protein